MPVRNNVSSSSVDILKEHIADLPIRSLDDEWIMCNKVELGSVMEDRSRVCAHMNSTLKE